MNGPGLTAANLEAWGTWLAKPNAVGAWKWDPALMMRDLGLQPDPWQTDFLNMDYRRALLLCSRRSGKTTAVAIKALHHAMFAKVADNALVLIFGPSGAQTDELLHHLHKFYKLLGKPVERDTDKKSVLDFENGARIMPLACNPDTVLGYTPTLVIIDEAARVPESLYEAILPMRALGKCQFVALSTPHGKRGWFYDEWRNPERNWVRVRKTADDCPRIDREVIEEDRISRGESYVKQEYYCSFEVMEGLVYPDFESCIVDPQRMDGIVAFVIGGCDFGWHNPSCFLAGVMTKDDVLHVVKEVYGSRMTDEELALAVSHICVEWGVDRVWCDTSDPQAIEKLKRAGVPARDATKAVLDGIMAVGSRMRTGRLKIWRTCTNLIHELGMYRYDPESKLSTDNPVKEYDHAPDALRYMVKGIDRGKPPKGYKAPEHKPEPEQLPEIDYGKDGDYRKPVPQQRYRTIEQRYEESEEARRLNQEHLWESPDCWETRR